MSISPSNMPFTYDLVAMGGLTGSSTGVGTTVKLPAGNKAIQVSLPTSATATVRVQNSIDGVSWFDISSSTVAPGYIAETYSTVPLWRVNISSFTTATLALVAQVALVIP